MNETRVQEPFFTAKQVSQLYGGSLSADFFRNAAKRADECHPLPHAKMGVVVKFRLSDVETWLNEETILNAGATWRNGAKSKTR